ncbi:MAG: aspartate carbamoyltransferase regulatory subunit [Candidatus Micrarchaeota archaeon]|nr:aspartate carbamoyltransferase regulatory subunit [Candidatus Micrarchaeota archaeon]
MPLMVKKIEEGTVMDHISAGMGIKVLQIISAKYPIEKSAALIINVPSKKLGKKDIVKLEGVFVDEKTANRISLIAPNATMNIIRRGKVVDKHKVVLPKVLSDLLKCPNPRCITRFEHVHTTFFVEGGKLRCKHCERTFLPEEFE